MMLIKNQKRCLVLMLMSSLIIPAISPIHSSREMQLDTEVTHIFTNSPEYIREDGDPVTCHDLHIYFNVAVNIAFPSVEYPEGYHPHHHLIYEIENELITIEGDFPPGTEITVTANHNGDTQIRVVEYWWTNSRGDRVGPRVPVNYVNIPVNKMEFTLPGEDEYKEVDKPIYQVRVFLKCLEPFNNIVDWELIKKEHPTDPSKTLIQIRIKLREPVNTKVKITVDPPDEIFEIVYEIQYDDVIPIVTINKPRDGLYFSNSLFLSIPDITIIFGSVDIEVDATDDLMMERVEIYIDGELKSIDTESPYVYEWNEFSSGKYTINAIAYDNATNNASDEIIVWKFF